MEINSDGNVITHVTQIKGWDKINDEQRDDVLDLFAEVTGEDEVVNFDYNGSLDPDNIDEEILDDVGEEYAGHDMHGFINAEDLGDGKYLLVCHSYCDSLYDLIITDDIRATAVAYRADWDSLWYDDDDLEQWLVDWRIPGAGLTEAKEGDEAPFALSRVTYGHDGLPWPSSTWIRHKPGENVRDEQDYYRPPVVTYDTYEEANGARKAMRDSYVVVRQYRG